MLSIKIFCAWAWLRIKCAFGGHGPRTYETRRPRWPAWCEVVIHCSDCGTELERKAIDQ